MESSEDSLSELADLVESCFKLNEIDVSTNRLEIRIDRQMEAMLQGPRNYFFPGRHVPFFDQITPLRKDTVAIGSEMYNLQGLMAFRAAMTSACQLRGMHIRNILTVGYQDRSIGGRW